MSFLVIHHANGEMTEIDETPVRQIIHRTPHSSSRLDPHNNHIGPFIEEREYVFAFGDDPFHSWSDHCFAGLYKEDLEFQKRKAKKLESLKKAIKQMEALIERK